MDGGGRQIKRGGGFFICHAAEENHFDDLGFAGILGMETLERGIELKTPLPERRGRR